MMKLKLNEQHYEPILRVTILILICVLAFSVRLFSVLRFESVIHEFDPYFNFRSTKYLIEEGFYNFHNWFDDRAWYPLGRIVGGTIYPGLMVTAAAVYHVVNFFNIPFVIRNVCVFLAPMMSGATALSGYVMGSEVKDRAAGLYIAAFMSIVPGYISRSVAGSYDNEGVAIFALVLTYTMWVKAVKTGSLFWSAMTALAYFYMVAAWGGYIFIINLIPFYTLVMLVSGRFTHRLYVAYCSFYVMATMLSMQVTFVGFQPVQSSEHLAAFGTFGILQLYVGMAMVKSHLGDAEFAHVARLVLIGTAALAAVGGGLAMATGYLSPFTGRFYALLDPTYASKHIPIIASVSEHQPTTWSSYFFDLHILTFLVPVGMYFGLTRPNDGVLFCVLYGITSVYFSGVMVRLMLILAPAACILGGVGLSSTLQTYMYQLRHPKKSSAASAAVSGAAAAPTTPSKKGSAANSDEFEYEWEVAAALVVLVTLASVLFVIHCTWVTSEAYSSPSIVLAASQADGSRLIFDDFREAYYWLRQNTPEDSKVMSWWDYGYQISAMANRTILVDNNTWNNSHIATVGRAMASSEENAYPIMRRLDVNYVLVIFGGLTGYASDDINKFLWMVRIANSTYDDIVEADYFTPKSEFKIDASGSPTMLDSLMYKMCYYRFGNVYTDQGKPTGFDRVRQCEIGRKEFDLEYLEEAYTTEHWLVRIYKVLEPGNRG